MTTQHTVTSIGEQDLISVEVPNSTSIMAVDVRPAATFLSFILNFPGNFSPYSTIEALFVTAGLLFITLLTIAGNATICFITIYFKRFRRSNYLLISLAVSDLLVGILVMPLAVIYQVSSDWYFGPISCNIWLSADVLNCTASIFNLCMVSVDRYWLITKPLKYERKRTKLRMFLYISTIWFLAMCVSLPPLIVLGNEYEEVQNGPTVCQLCQHFIYQIYAVVICFYIPVLVIIILNYKLYTAARNKSTMNYYESRFDMELESDFEMGVSLDRRTHMRTTICPRHSHNEHIRPISLPEIRIVTASTSNNSPRRHLTDEHQKIPAWNILQKSIRMLRMRNSQVCTCNKRQQKRRKSEGKASTTLGIIVGVFVFCWLPFFLLALMKPFFNPDAIPHLITSLFLWLGYCNSALNPIIYAVFNKDFRKPFILIMCLRWRNLNEMMREEYYHRQFGGRRTRSGINDGNNGTENTDRADLIDDNNHNVGYNNHNVDNNNQNVDNNNRNVDNQGVGHNNKDIDDNNRNNEDNNQDISEKNQNVDDNNQVVIDSNQIIIKIAEKSNKMPPFCSDEYSSNDIRRQSSIYCMDTFLAIAEVHASSVAETLV
ncbi:hypothetical protein P5V15_014624 [Pogonomyrmex californicus]